MRFRFIMVVALVCAVCLMGLATAGAVFAQGTSRTQNDATPSQRLTVMRSRLEGMRRTLSSALAGLNAGDESKSKKDKKAVASNDAGTRLRGLDKEVGSLLSEVNELNGKQDRAERYDVAQLDKLESAVTDLNGRVESALRETAGERRNAPPSETATTASNKSNKNKKKTGLIGRLLGRGGDNKYDELINQTGPGRDRELFAAGTKEACKSNYEGARLLFNVIITTYPDSPFLPQAKLAIADTFYLEGETSALIQAAAAYQEWLTFFPTDPLSDDVMLKIAEVEMRQMGLPNRQTDHARRAEQRLKVLLQQFPNTNLRPDAELRLREVQENLGMHTFQVGNFYYDRYQRHVAPNPKGAQSRYLELVEKYPNFSLMDEALFRLGTTYVDEEEPDEAAKYFSRLARDYPNSNFLEKAKEQLQAIGAPVPEPDPKRMNIQPPEHPSFTQRVMTEVIGSADVTVNKDGVLISRDCKDNDLINLALQNNGQIPMTTPTAPVSSQRIAPARAVVPQPAPTTTTNKPKTTNGVKLQPTQAGPPATVNSPTAPPSTPPPSN